MIYVTDLNGERLEVQDVQASLQQVIVFLTDKEILPGLNEDEIKYYQDLKEKLMQLL